MSVKKTQETQNDVESQSVPAADPQDTAPESVAGPTGKSPARGRSSEAAAMTAETEGKKTTRKSSRAADGTSPSGRRTRSRSARETAGAPADVVSGEPGEHGEQEKQGDQQAALRDQADGMEAAVKTSKPRTRRTRKTDDAASGKDAADAAPATRKTRSRKTVKTEEPGDAALPPAAETAEPEKTPEKTPGKKRRTRTQTSREQTEPQVSGTGPSAETGAAENGQEDTASVDVAAAATQDTGAATESQTEEAPSSGRTRGKRRTARTASSRSPEEAGEDGADARSEKASPSGARRSRRKKTADAVQEAGADTAAQPEQTDPASPGSPDEQLSDVSSDAGRTSVSQETVLQGEEHAGSVRPSDPGEERTPDTAPSDQGTALSPDDRRTGAEPESPAAQQVQPDQTDQQPDAGTEGEEWRSFSVSSSEDTGADTMRDALTRAQSDTGKKGSARAGSKKGSVRSPRRKGVQETREKESDRLTSPDAGTDAALSRNQTDTVRPVPEQEDVVGRNREDVSAESSGDVPADSRAAAASTESQGEQRVPPAGETVPSRTEPLPNDDVKTQAWATLWDRSADLSMESPQDEELDAGQMFQERPFVHDGSAHPAGQRPSGRQERPPFVQGTAPERRDAARKSGWRQDVRPAGDHTSGDHVPGDQTQARRSRESGWMNGPAGAPQARQPHQMHQPGQSYQAYQEGPVPAEMPQQRPEGAQAGDGRRQPQGRYERAHQPVRPVRAPGQNGGRPDPAQYPSRPQDEGETSRGRPVQHEAGHPYGDASYRESSEPVFVSHLRMPQEVSASTDRDEARDSLEQLYGEARGNRPAGRRPKVPKRGRKGFPQPGQDMDGGDEKDSRRDAPTRRSVLAEARALGLEEQEYVDADELQGMQDPAHRENGAVEPAVPRKGRAQEHRKMFFSILSGECIEVAITERGRLCEYYLDMQHQKKLKGNIYKAIIQNIDTSLQAAFVNYGTEKNGFLQVDEIHREYWLTHFDPSPGCRIPPIQKIIKPGQEVLVQVVKEPNGSKGSFLTTKISLAGRFLVLTPGQEQVGVSRKVVDDGERARLKELINGISPGQDMGVIVRTVSEGTTKTTLKNDLQYLKRIWRDIRKKATEVSAPALIYKEPGLIERALRDYFTNDVAEIWVDDKDVYENVYEIVSLLYPKRENLVRLYQDTRRVSLFERFNLRRQVDEIYAREVFLPSGGRLVFDQTEALMAIDVNSGKISCKGNFELMAYRTNMEAAESIARQLRLRDVGGQVVIDFIEMRDRSHIEDVENTLRRCMRLDRARFDMVRMSTFGLLELVRQRTAFSALSITEEPCPFCGGTGQRRNMEWQSLKVAYEIQHKMLRTRDSVCTYEAPPELGMYLLNHKREMLQELERQFNKRLEIIIRGVVS